jgi:hypothetical protein
LNLQELEFSEKLYTCLLSKLRWFILEELYDVFSVGVIISELLLFIIILDIEGVLKKIVLVTVDFI